MGELIIRLAGDDAGLQEESHVSVESDLSKAHDDANARQRLDLLGEMDAAVANLLGKWLVAGGSAADDGGDPGMAKLEAIVAGDGAGFAGEPEFVKDGIHEVAGAVAGKGAASTIGSVSTRGEAKDKDTSAGVAEAGDRARPVGLVEVGAAFGLAETAAVVAKTWAALAGDDGLANLLQEWGRTLCVGRCHFSNDSCRGRSERFVRQTTE